MKQFVIRADDLGYSEAVNYGIAKTVKEGIIGSVGVMPNMPAAPHGLELLYGTDVCLGQHTNLCIGKPCADPEKIPSLLDQDGNLRSSREYRAAWKAGEDFVVLEEVILEIEAQYLKFKELTGQEPDYFEAHAVTSKNLYRGLEMVAEKYHLRYNRMSPLDKEGTFDKRPVAACAMNSMLPDYDAKKSILDAVMHANEKIPNIYVCHPGYLDAFLIRTSSLREPRTLEVEMLCDKNVADWLKTQEVELLTYREI